jgi:cation:H+ antiporter
MLSQLTVLVVSLVVLVKSADYVVQYGARVAHRFQASDLFVGLIITAVGTSLPELASALAASFAGSPGLVIGNVVGSNIANIGLVLAAAALVRPFGTSPKMHDRDGFIVVASAALLFVLVLDNRIGRLDAGLFLALYIAYTAFVVRSDREGVEHRFKDFLKFVFDFEYAAPVARGLRGRGLPSLRRSEARTERDLRGVGREIGVLVASLGALVLGARFVVSAAVRVADHLLLPENLVGLSLLALGTSLPELLVAITAARRGRPEMVVGSVVGSNIANALLIVGLAGIARPLEVSELSVVYTIPIMLFFSIALLYFIRSDWRIGRDQGAVALAAYVGFLVAAFVYGWS